MAEIIDYITEESPYWTNMFGQVPVQYDDTEEYQYVEYLESTSGGAKPGFNQTRFVLYNRDIDPYLLMHKGFIAVRGYIATAATAGGNAEAFFNADDPTGQIAPCNLFNFAIWDRAELRLENSLVQKLDNPRLIALTKYLTKYAPENEKTQGTLSFFYKDTGSGGTASQPITTTTTATTTTANTLRGNVYTDTADGGGGATAANNFIKVGNEGGTGLQAGNNVDLLATGAAGSGIVLTVTATTTTTSTSVANLDYNQGFVSRRNRCVTRGAATKKSFEFYLPLSDLFGFYENYNAPFRGLKHEITLDRNLNSATYLHRDAGTANGEFVFEKISMWIPRIKPSYEKLAELNQKFIDKAQTVMRWSDHRYEISNSIQQTSLSNQMRVGSLAGRPTYCYVFFQLDTTINGNQEVNKNIFSNLTNAGVGGLSQIEMRINSLAIPLQTFTVNLTEDKSDYLRAYLYLLESQGKMLSDAPGMVISYEEFRTLYPLFIFDFTRIEKRMYENISASEIEVRWGLHSAAPSTYKCHVIIEHDRVAVSQAVDSKLLITL